MISNFTDTYPAAFLSNLDEHHKLLLLVGELALLFKTQNNICSG